MAKYDPLVYLEDERKKLWKAVIELDEKINKRTPEHEKDAIQASRKASEYRNRCEESRNTISLYETESSENLNAVRTILSEIIKNRNESVANSEFIESNTAVSNKLLGDLESRINAINEEIETLETTFSNHEDYLCKITKLEAVSTKAEDLASKIELIHKNALVRRKEIDDLYLEVFGYTETDDSGEETTVPGLKEELEDSYNALSSNLDQFKVDFANHKVNTKKEYEEFRNTKESDFIITVGRWQKEYLAIVKQIKDLLPNALTAGLSSAYTKKKEDEVRDITTHTGKFEKAIISLVFVSLIPFAVSIALMVQGKALDKVLLDMPRLVLAILPLYVPVLWVAYSTSKKINLSKRLVEEYTHKEVLSKTFEGLSTQISTISDSDISADLRIKLLYNILEVSSENPGKLITDYNKADHPLMDALEKSVQLTNAVEKLSLIPGFSAIASVLDKQSKNLLKEKADKANAGLAVIRDKGKNNGKEAEADPGLEPKTEES
ncbi:MAG: hypothetical protein A2075_22135 [Geobacteraceae bacterium GWC2_58_44]|nr:MAG: hypothetical protein A2075_22135 [Geobacteraceae bacterium GWC2_58_44]